MRNLTYILCVFSIISMSCRGQDAKLSSAGPNYFGERITADGAKAFTEVTWPVTSVDTVDIKLKGIIHEVCQAKGCWMTLQHEDMLEDVFIKFKDYGFFVPKDASGKDAVISGKLYAAVTSVDELRHYAEDKGASAEEIAAISQPQREMKMMADGVIIYN